MTRYLIVPLIFFAISLLTSAHAGAQNSCEEPFAGIDRLRFDPSYWSKTDFCMHNVDLAEIRSGGPPPDGIPPLDDPRFESIELAGEWLVPQQPVIAVEVNGMARAYPLAILMWHEIVNDEIGGVPVAVTFCPLCNASLVFDRRVGDSVLRFGVSGNLRNSDMVMWDDLTESWWQQFTGEGIVGLYTGTQLTLLPSLVVNFGAFAEQYPDGEVLSRETGYNRSYGSNPYAGYDSSSTPFLFSGEIDSRLAATERVLAGVIGGEAIAYSFSTLEEMLVINDTVGGESVVAFWQPGMVSVLDQSDISLSRDVGMAALYSRVVDGEILTFNIGEDGVMRDDLTNSTWTLFGEAVDGEFIGKQLTPMFAAPHLWFAWAAFRPETRIYGEA